MTISTLSIALLYLAVVDTSSGGGGTLHIPMPLLVSGVVGLCGAMAYVFRLLIESHERRAKELLDHVTTLQTEKTADREEFASRLESIVKDAYKERDETRAAMIESNARNTDAIRQNTAARDESNKHISHLIPEITAAVILKAIEFGMFVRPPHESISKAESPTQPIK